MLESGKRLIVDRARAHSRPLPPGDLVNMRRQIHVAMSTQRAPGTRLHTHMTQPVAAHRCTTLHQTDLHRYSTPISTNPHPHCAVQHSTAASRKRESQHEPKTKADIHKCGAGTPAAAGPFLSSLSG